MKKEILIYTDSRTATGSLTDSLKRSFPKREFAVRTIKLADLKAGILKQPESRVFVLPGIFGDNSLYQYDLRTDEVESIHDFVNGGRNVVLTICAGTYYFSRMTTYVPPWRNNKYLQSLKPFFNGVANGPLHPYASQKPGLAPVAFTDKDGNLVHTEICYGNGPRLDPDKPDDPNMEVLARYHGMPDSPAALLRLKKGLGTVYMSSAHPEIRYINIGNATVSDDVRQLTQALKPHEKNRHKLWDMLTNRIKQDIS